MVKVDSLEWMIVQYVGCEVKSRFLSKQIMGLHERSQNLSNEPETRKTIIKMEYSYMSK